MGQVKNVIHEYEENNSENWRTWKCRHCGEYYKVNIKTGTGINEEGWCFDCRATILNM